MICSDVRNGEIICKHWGNDYQQLAESIAFYEGYSLTFCRDDGVVICESTAIADTKQHYRGEKFEYECFSIVDNFDKAVIDLSEKIASLLLKNENYIITRSPCPVCRSVEINPICGHCN